MSRSGQASATGKQMSVKIEEPKKSTIGGVPVPRNEDSALVINSTPAFDFPPRPPPDPPRRKEKIEAAHYRALRERIHDGPLYTVLGRGVRVGKTPPPPAATFDPFGGQPTYSSQKFLKHRRKVPQLHTRPFIKEFFPEELHAALDPKNKHDDEDEDDNKHSHRPSKKLGISLGRKLSRLEKLEEQVASRAAGKQKVADNDEKDVAEDEEGSGEQRDDELDLEMEDDEFDDGEADDYEQNYFDNGEEEFGDDGGDEYGAGED